MAELRRKFLIRVDIILAFLFLGTLFGLKLSLQFGSLLRCHFTDIHIVSKCYFSNFPITPRSILP